MRLADIDSIHIVGIGGAGMSAIAEFLIQMGYKVSGSDMNDSDKVSYLKNIGAEVSIGHNPKNVGGDVVVISTAIRMDNVEVVEAEKQQIPVWSRSDMLTRLTNYFVTAAVAGTHGKTTTSAMLAHTMSHANLHPSFIVGGEMIDFNTGAKVDGEFFIVEADESDGTFLNLSTAYAIVTSLEPDHLEFYGGFENLKSAFSKFITSQPTTICIDDKHLFELSKQIECITYGTHELADIRIENVSVENQGVAFVVSGLKHITEELDTLEVQLRHPGLHNARNATAALIAAIEHGAEPMLAVGGLESFQGVKRRFQSWGIHRNIHIVEDYAHLPTEIEAALQAAKSLNPKRIITVFQPHRYSRTEELWETFNNCFEGSDKLYISDIYSSGETPREGVNAGLIMSNVQAAGQDNVDGPYSLDVMLEKVVAELQDGDLCLILGAGDVNSLAPALVGKFS